MKPTQSSGPLLPAKNLGQPTGKGTALEAETKAFKANKSPQRIPTKPKRATLTAARLFQSGGLG